MPRSWRRIWHNTIPFYSVDLYIWCCHSFLKRDQTVQTVMLQQDFSSAVQIPQFNKILARQFSW